MNQPKVSSETICEFKLQSHEDKIISLAEVKSDYIILYFYPKDDTPGCTIEAQEFSRLKSEFEAENAVIFGISKDDKISHQKFVQKYGLGIDLLSDDQDLAQKFGVWVEKSMYGKKYMGIERTTFLLDKSRKIIKIWQKVKAEGHALEVLEYIKSIK